MISYSDYSGSRLMVCPDFGEEYRDVVVRNILCREQPIHIHSCMEIVYVFRGALECRIGCETYILRENEFAVLNALEVHSLKAITDGAAISCIHISDRLFPGAEAFIVWWADILKRNREIYEKQIVNIRTLILQYERKASNKTIEACVRSIRQLFQKNFKIENYHYLSHDELEYSESDMKRLWEIYTYFSMHYDEKLSLDYLAREFAMSKYYLSHFMKKVTGYSVQQFLNIYRCDRAEIALLDSDRPIEEIRSDFAFSSIAYFNTVFRRLYHMSPAEYRKQRQKDTVIHKAFSQHPLEHVFDFVESSALADSDDRTEFSPDDRTVTLHLKKGAGTLIRITGTTDGKEELREYELSEHQDLHIDLDLAAGLIEIKAK